MVTPIIRRQNTNFRDAISPGECLIITLYFLAFGNGILPRGGDIINKLLCREAFWIHTLNTLEPQGLNEELSLPCFL